MPFGGQGLETELQEPNVSRQTRNVSDNWLLTTDNWNALSNSRPPRKGECCDKLLSVPQNLWCFQFCGEIQTNE